MFRHKTEITICARHRIKTHIAMALTIYLQNEHFFIKKKIYNLHDTNVKRKGKCGMELKIGEAAKEHRIK